MLIARLGNGATLVDPITELLNPHLVKDPTNNPVLTFMHKMGHASLTIKNDSEGGIIHMHIGMTLSATDGNIIL